MNTPQVNNASEWNIKEIVWEMIKTFALAIVIIIPIRMFLFQPFFVDGESMEPTFKDNEYLIVYEHGYKQVKVGNVTLLHPSKKFQRGDVVVFHPPVSDKRYYIKRVIARPGEGIAVVGGQVILYTNEYPDGEVLKEPYISSDAELVEMPKRTLKDNEYFLMGDNRNFSSDSRAFGPVNGERIIGKVILRALPLSRAGVL